MSDGSYLWHPASRVVLPQAGDALEVPVQDGEAQRYGLVHGEWRHYPDGYPALDRDILFHIGRPLSGSCGRKDRRRDGPHLPGQARAGRPAPAI